MKPAEGIAKSEKGLLKEIAIADFISVNKALLAD
jgi:hypothetical protein